MPSKDPSETEQPRGRYPAAAFEAAQQVAGKAPSSGSSQREARDPSPLPDAKLGPLTGKSVSHYRVLELIGGGGMGVVYRAQDVKLGRLVALKFLPDEFGQDPRARERFEREARAASALDHPNICSIYEFGEHEGKLFIVMQLLRGQTLKEKLATVKNPSTGEFVGHALPTDQLLRIAIEICDGLEAAHEKGIVHRDIKPANIFVTQRDVTKILDFGLVKLLQADEQDFATDADQHSAAPLAATHNVELSHAGVAVGTAAYMSPEQVRGEQLDARTDLFCVGMLLYEMATGRRAFAGKDPATVRNAILTQTPRPIRQVNAQQPARLQRIINKCLDKDPARRFQRASDIRTELDKLCRLLEHPLRRRWKLALASVVVIAGMVAGGVKYLHKETKFKEKDSIVLADFNNPTDESVWDTTLRQRLTKDLEDSNYLNVLPDQTVSDTLKFMKRQPDERLTKELAREVCRRNSGKAMLSGSIAKMGEQYHLDLRAINCQTGATLASADADADSKERVLGALKSASNELRRQLGESLPSVQKYNAPLPPATTASLEAIEAYAMGLKLKAAQGSGAAVPFCTRAIELDPDFADAYAALGAVYMDMGQATLSMQNAQKAYELRDHVSSQRERFHIEGNYYDSVTGEMEKANQTYVDWIQLYPDDFRPHQNLGANYSDMGQYEKAGDERRTVLQLQPNNVSAFTSLVGVYNALGLWDKAKGTFDEAHARKLDHSFLGLYRYHTAFCQGDEAAMQQQVQWAMGKPEAEEAMLSAESDTEAFYGRFDRAREFTQRATQSARNADAPERAAGWEANAALREAEVGNLIQARAIAEEGLSMSDGRDVAVQSALALVRAGQTGQAEKLAAKLDREFPRSTMMQNYWLPTIRAAIALQRNNPKKAIELLEVTGPYELGNQSLGHMYPAYLRGEAYLRLGQAQEAAREFQKVLDHPGIVLNFVTGALAHLQLARAQAVSGNPAAALKNYREFLTLWKDADAGLPVLRAAQAEYGRLK